MKQLLAVEINGQCQLHCPHCYIDMEEWPKTLMSNNTIENLPVHNYLQVAIVATEPFFSRESSAATLSLGRRAREAGKQFSVISNALGLARALELEPKLAQILSWIDISMDAPGESAYKAYRGGSWRKFSKGVESAHAHGIEVTILNTVSTRTLPFFEEMISVSDELASAFFTVSLMLEVESRSTAYRTSPLVSIRSFLEMCAKSPAFQKSKKVRLDIGGTTCKQSSEDIKELESLARSLQIDDKAYFFPQDPDEIIDRVRVSGEFVLPSQTLRATQK